MRSMRKAEHRYRHTGWVTERLTRGNRETHIGWDTERLTQGNRERLTRKQTSNDRDKKRREAPPRSREWPSARVSLFIGHATVELIFAGSFDQAPNRTKLKQFISIYDYSIFLRIAPIKLSPATEPNRGELSALSSVPFLSSAAALLACSSTRP